MHQHHRADHLGIATVRPRLYLASRLWFPVELETTWRGLLEREQARYPDHQAASQRHTITLLANRSAQKGTDGIPKQ